MSSEKKVIFSLQQKMGGDSAVLASVGSSFDHYERQTGVICYLDRPLCQLFSFQILSPEDTVTMKTVDNHCFWKVESF